MYTLDEKQAYKAMFLFLEHMYNLTNDDSLGAILGSMQLLSDGKPIDGAYWQDWLDVVSKATSSEST